MMKFRIENLLFIFLLIACLFFTPDASLDLYRYFDEAREGNMSLSIAEYARIAHESQFDFIYQTVLFSSFKLGVPLRLINVLFVFMYLYSGRKILRFCASKIDISRNNYKYSLILLLCAIPFIYVYSISRMVAAFSFLFLAIYNLVNRRYIYAIVLSLITVFTHVGSLIYIFIFLIVIILSPILRISQKKLLLIGVPFTFFAGAVILGYIINLVASSGFFGVYSYYLKYLDNFEGISFVGQSTITMIASFWSVIIYGIYTFIMKRTVYSQMLILIFLCLIFSMTLNNMFFQRTLLFSLPFISISSLYIPNKYILSKKMILVITLSISLLTYIAYYKNFINLF